jgi:hypothetical protein
VARDIELQRKVVADARRARRLLEILRQKKFAAHARLSLREEDAIAADLHLAKLSRERAGEPGTDRPIHLPKPAKNKLSAGESGR